MFIAHLPSAYLVFKAVVPRLSPPAFAAGMVASILPDIDMLWFYTYGNRAVVHHEYITHRPIIWLGFVLLGLVVLRRRAWGTATIAFGAGGLIHVALDTIAGRINWLWPFGEAGGPLVVVHANHSHWVLSFANHWTFKVELAICALAAIVLWRSRTRG